MTDPKGPPGEGFDLNDERIRTFFDGAACALVAHDGYQVVYVNRAAGTLLGGKPSEIAGRSVERLVPERDLPVLAQQTAEALERGRGSHQRLTFCHESGGLIHVEAAANPLRKGDRSVVLMTCFDLTALRRRTEEFDAVRMAFPDLHFRHDSSGRFVEHYAGQTDDLYTQPGEFLGRKVSEVLPPEVSRRVEKGMSECLRTGKALSVEYELELPQGVKHFEARLVPLPERGETLSVVRNITDQKVLQQERNRLVEKLEQAVKARDDFLRIASHELSTPLTSAQLAFSALKSALAVDEPPSLTARQCLDIVGRQIARVSRLVTGLLDVTRIQAGKIVMDLQDVDLVELVRRVVEEFKPELDRAGSTVRVQGPAALTGRWDPNRLDQVVTNLLLNAAKYGRGNPIDLEIRERDGKAQLIVRDRGIGIPADRVGCIFDPFQQGVPLEKYGGLGLGLYVVHQLVRQHQGAVSVSSEEGRGTEFLVDLPLRPEELPNRS